MPYNWKSTSFTEVVRGTFNLSWEADWFRVEKKRQSPTSSLLHTFESFRWKPMIITIFSNKCINRGCWKRNQDPHYWIELSKAQDLAHKSHLRSSPIILCQEIAFTELFLKTEIEYCLKDSRPQTSTQSYAEKQLAIAAGAAATVDLQGRDLHKETCAPEDGDKRCQRQHNRWSNSHKETCARFWTRCWEKATIRNWSSSRRSISRCHFTRWSKDEWNQRIVGNFLSGITHKIHLQRFVERYYDLQCRIKTRYLRDGQHGVNRVETNLGDYSMFFLPEARMRRREHVLMWCLASTQSKYDGPKQNSICSVPYQRCHFKRNEKWSQSLQKDHHKAIAIGWTETYVKYLDYISEIDISFHAPHQQRVRYNNTVHMRGVDSNKQAGPLCQRPGYKSWAQALVSLQQAQGKGVPHFPMHLRTRQNNKHILSRSPTTSRVVEFPLARVFLIVFILDMERKLEVVEFFILEPSTARLVLSRMERQRMVGPATTTTTPRSSTSTCTSRLVLSWSTEPPSAVLRFF